MSATDMSDIHDTTRDPDTRLENFAAELTSAVYPLLLRGGPKSSWIKVELCLWRALAETVRKWARQRPRAALSDESDAWREALLADLTDSAFSIAVANGVEAPFLDLELDLDRAFRLALGRRS
jgi:hypothetical protein